LGYGFESHEKTSDRYFEWIITIPTRRNYERIFIRGVEGEADINDVHEVRDFVEMFRVDEGWVVAPRRVSQLAAQEARKEGNRKVYCYTFDELIDQEADFSKYFDWLENEVKHQKISEYYVPLACSKEEIDYATKQHLGISLYDKKGGWTDGYINRWLDDPSKAHISILGEFGTGKTWFSLHYAWLLLQKYTKAKEEGVERPRLPLVIPLRDYAKAVSVESLFSEFFFRKHQIELRGGYPTFEYLNRIGKLLLIFDGFDEMAARISRQEMINNFWELSKVVVPGAKAILTCRTEHFPEAKEGRAILNAELKASTANLTGEPPQFEVLELEKFNDEQVQKVLAFHTKVNTVNTIMINPQLLDLARRPVMIDLVIEALPEIEAGMQLDITRVYFYAIRRKMERDIKQERTFTSMLDKLYFLCELAWNMLSTNRLSLNYKEFSIKIGHLFGDVVQEQKDLDHWHYDMMGQTILTRNAIGDYAFAHRSFLEFFVAYKIAAEVGILSSDFIEFYQQKSSANTNFDSCKYTWSEYVQSQRKDDFTKLAPISTALKCESIESLRLSLGKISLSTAEKAVLELIEPMIDKCEATVETLLGVIESTKQMNSDQAGYLGGNATTLLLKCDDAILSGRDLSGCIIVDADLTRANLLNTNFASADLSGCSFIQAFGSVFSLAFQPGTHKLALGDATGSIRLFDVYEPQNFTKFEGHQGLIRSIIFSPDGKLLASGSEDGTVRLWNSRDGSCLMCLSLHTKGVRSVAFSPDGKLLASGSEDGTVRLWNSRDGSCLMCLSLHTKGVRSVAFSPDGKLLASGSEDGTVRLWNSRDGSCLMCLEESNRGIWSIAFNSSEQIIFSGATQDIFIWDFHNDDLRKLSGHSGRVRSLSTNRTRKIFASGSEDRTIKLWDIYSGHVLEVLEGHDNWIRSVSFSSDGKLIASGSEDQVVKVWDLADSSCLRTIVGSVGFTKAISFSKDDKFLASSSHGNSIKIWKIGEVAPFKNLVGHNSFVRSLSFNADGTKVMSGSDDGHIKLWDIQSGKEIRAYIGHLGWVNIISSCSKKNVFASGGEDKTVRIWNMSSKECFMELSGHTDGIRALSFCPKGEKVASGSADRSVKVWDLSTGKCINTLTGYKDWVITVAFSHCSRFLATGSSGKNIKVWDLSSSKQLVELCGHQDWVYSVKFSSSNNILISSSRDGTIKVWDIISGTCQRTITQDSLLISTKHSHKENLVACAYNDGSIKIWNVITSKVTNVIHDRTYEGMNINDVKGLSSSQIRNLKELGAIDKQNF
jgi:WD40 repeat protein